MLWLYLQSSESLGFQMNQYCDAEALYMSQAYTAAETLDMCFKQVTCDAEAEYMSFEQVNRAHCTQKPCLEPVSKAHPIDPVQKPCTCVLNK